MTIEYINYQIYNAKFFGGSTTFSGSIKIALFARGGNAEYLRGIRYLEVIGFFGH